MSLQSYEILGLSPDCTMDEAKKSFHHLALQTHPDRGGNPKLFKMVLKAFRDVEYTLNCQKRQQYNSMRDESRTVIKEQAKKPSKHPMLDPKKFNRKKFNKIFEQYRIQTPEDQGYDLSVEETVNAEDYETRVTQFEEPEVILCNGAYTNLGQSKINDFTAPFNAKRKYTDARLAYANPTEEAHLQTRPEYSSLNELRQTRNTMNLNNTPEEAEEYKRVQLERIEIERLRQQTYQQQMDYGAKRGQQMRNFLL
jgi:curved DNA-binding protein CbpA